MEDPRDDPSACDLGFSWEVIVFGSESRVVICCNSTDLMPRELRFETDQNKLLVYITFSNKPAIANLDGIFHVELGEG